MVEVFKTNVVDFDIAQQIIDCIHFNHQYYTANFDLEDCDNILRIQTEKEEVCAKTIIAILALNGCHAEVLQDS